MMRGAVTNLAPPPSSAVTKADVDWMAAHTVGGGVWKQNVSKMWTHRHHDDHEAKSIWKRITG